MNNDNDDIKNLYVIATKQRGFFYGSTPPQQPNTGDKWHDSTDNLIKMWDGDSWESIISKDADTVKGHEPGTAANNLLVLDGNGKVPKANLPFYVPVGGTIIWKHGLDATNTYPMKDGITYTDWQVDTDFDDLMPLGASASRPLNSTGGEETVTLTIQTMPKHAHKLHVGEGYNGTGYADQGGQVDGGFVSGFIDEVGGDQPHNNMSPYRAVYFITRVA